MASAGEHDLSGARAAKWLALARQAVDAQNNAEAYRYYGLALEEDQSCVEAWIGKGRAAGKIASLEDMRLAELLSCYQKGLQLADPDRTVELLPDLVADVNSLARFLFDQSKKVMASRKAAAPGYGSIVLAEWNRHAQLTLVLIEGVQRAIEWLPDDKDSRITVARMCEELLTGVMYQTVDGWPMEARVSVPDSTRDALTKLLTENCEWLGEPLEVHLSRIDAKKQNKAACFVATAAAGDANDPDVVTLRAYRDQVLAGSAMGRAAISVYNVVGPIMAWCVAQSHWAQLICLRLVVRPVAQAARRSRHSAKR